MALNLFGMSGGSSGASINTAFNDFGGAVGDLLSGEATAQSDQMKAQADFAEAQVYGLEGEEATVNSNITRAQTQRQAYQASSATQSEISNAGFQLSGSGLDIMRENAQQGALQQAMSWEKGQTEIDTAAIEQQAATNAGNAEESMASTASTDGLITGGIKAVAGIAALAML